MRSHRRVIRPNGADWTALALAFPFTKAPAPPGYAHDTTVDFGGAAAKFVRLTATTNWGASCPNMVSVRSAFSISP